MSLEDELDYEELLSSFVDEEYVNMIDDSAMEYVEEYCDRGNSPYVCVAVGLSETENLGWNLKEIASELDVTRRAIYDAREELELVENNPRGRHVARE